MRRAVVSLVVLGCLFGASTRARCGPLLLRIKGETSAHAAKKILVTVAPDPNHSSPLVLLEGDKFEADVYYDPFKSHSAVFGQNCTERPKTITVELLENGKEVDKKELEFSRDFVDDGDGGFVPRRQLRLGETGK
jgi:hypothetical protein